MFILFIVGLLLGSVAVIFALQNVAVVTVSFFSWKLEGSLAVILLLALSAGIVTALLIVLPGSIDNYFKQRGLKKENQKLAEALRKQKELTVFAKNTPATPEAIASIEHGVIADSNIY
ncbi:MAG: LapA family protein [Candidatus Pacebacteria bacterium]|nr:LapA family protein [Candidatus Paceibacterota bacterium]MDD5357392.1 LapA family protein [Candidatus Paceibacterota bacterium]